MDSYARIAPNKIGQPLKILLQLEATRTIGLQIGAGVAVTLEGDTIRVQRGKPFTLRGGNGGYAPQVSASAVLAALQSEQIDRAPKHAVIDGDSIIVYPYQSITESQYRYRRWSHYTRGDTAMNPANATLLNAKTKTKANIIVPVPLELLPSLREDAQAAQMTVPSFILEVLRQRQPVAVKTADGRSPAEIGHIHRQNPEKIWSIAELEQRNLPLCWNRDWLKAELNAGQTFQGLAQAHGYSSGLYSKWAQIWQLRSKKAKRGSARIPRA